MTNLAVYRIRKNVPGHGRKIAEALDAEEVTSLRPRYKLNPGAVVINYGRSTIPAWDRPDISYINHPNAVGNAVDKSRTLPLLIVNAIPTLQYTCDINFAKRLVDSGTQLYARLTTTGKKGQGIKIITNPKEFVEAPLYTERFPTTHEFRVHVGSYRGVTKVLDYVQKKRLGKKKLEERGIEFVNDNIRNRRFGWVFCHNDILKFQEVMDAACGAVNALGLNYAGVDVLTQVSNTGELLDLAVCEVNSAPAVGSSTTFDSYINFFNKVLENNWN